VAANLPFERFLSHARIKAGSFPDIDLDIADRARPFVMKYLQDKYGLGFAQISTFSKMKTKNAIKDAMYALYGRNRKDEEITAVCDEIDDSPQGVDEYDFLYGYVDQEGEEHKGEIEKKPILANFFQQKPEVEEMVKKLLGSIRGWSRHASAFVISTIDLADGRVPTMLMSDKNLGDVLVTQFDANMVEKSGLVKADILGIKTLTMASDAMALIKQNHNIDFLEEEKGVPLIYRLPDADSGFL
jgi:DNA polymerase-3 subunit alpha